MSRFPELLLEETEPDSSKYVLRSDDFDLYSPSFQLCDKDGGGHDWQSVAEFLVRSISRKHAKAISFDSEASLFCALSDKSAALEELADLLRQTFRSKRRLINAIQQSDAFAAQTKPQRTKFTTVVVIHFNCYLYDDLDPLIDALKSGLSREHVLVYSPCSSGETTLYLRTDDSNGAVSMVKLIMRDFKLLKSAIIATAPRTATEYSVVYPRRRKTPLVPKNKLCPTIP